MFNSGIFDYANVLTKAADASWVRNEVLSNNIANGDTPGYKRKDVRFEDHLQRELGNTQYETLSDKVSNVHMSRLEPMIYTDNTAFSYRLDGNNVDPETEQVEKAANEVKYSAMIDAIKGEFASIKMVIK